MFSMRVVGKGPKRRDRRGVLAVSAIVLKQTGKQAGGFHALSQGQLVGADFSLTLLLSFCVQCKQAAWEQSCSFISRTLPFLMHLV